MQIMCFCTFEIALFSNLRALFRDIIFFCNFSISQFFFQEGELSLAFLKKFVNYARSRCGPRLSAEAAEKLKNKYVQMRNATKQQEEQTEKRVAIPITVRQLEAIGKKHALNK